MFKSESILFYHMSNPVPVYVVDLHSSNESHIVVGVNIKTLCGKKDVKSAIQIPDDIDPKDYILQEGIPRSICDDCLERWKEIKYDIFREPTEKCITCKNITSGHMARELEHSSVGKGPVCKVCYTEIYNHASSNVETPYEEAEPYRETKGPRTYTYSKN